MTSLPPDRGDRDERDADATTTSPAASPRLDRAPGGVRVREAAATAESVSSELAESVGGGADAGGGGSVAGETAPSDSVAAGGAVAAMPTAAPLTLDWGGELAVVEAALAGGEEESAEPSPLPASPRPPHVPPWLTDPRLLAALASDDAALDTWLALTGAAVAGYRAGGRPRRAAALAAGAARALTTRGDAPRAAAALAAHAAIAAAEGWTRLAGDLLGDLGEAQAAVAGGGAHAPPSTPLALLSLPPADVAPAARARAAAALAAVASGGGPAPPLAGAPPAPDLATADGAALSAGAALSVWAPPGASSRLAVGAVATPRPSVDGGGGGGEQEDAPPVAPGGGAPRAAVGDDVSLCTILSSTLPTPLEGATVDLVLGLLQPVSVELARASGGGGGEGGGAPSFARAWRETSTIHVPATPASAAIPPGETRLTAAFCPLARGVYVLRGARVRWGRVSLAVDTAGAQTVVVVAGAPTPRVTVRPVGDRPLLSGVPQWVGIDVCAAPSGGGGEGARVTLTPCRRGAAAGAARVALTIAPDALAVPLDAGGAVSGPAHPVVLTPADAAPRAGGSLRAALPSPSARLFVWATPDAPPPPTPPPALRADAARAGDRPPPPPPPAPACVEVDVSVETGARAAAARVAHAVAPPLALTPRAHPVAGGGLLLEVEAASRAPWSVVVQGATLDAARGVRRARGAALSDSLPLVLPPGGVARLLVCVSVADGDGDGGPCAVEVAWQREGDGGGDGDSRPPPPPSAPQPSGLARCEFTLPAAPAAASADGGGGGASVPASSTVAGAAPPVCVRLLGPLAARAGAPVTLCWRLERPPGTPPPADAPTDLAFEVRPPPGGGWAPGGARAGRVALAATPRRRSGR